MASLAISESELFALIATVVGISRDSADWDTQTTNDVDRILRLGRRKFFSSNDWSFLNRDWVQATTAPQTTGTITVVNGTVTLTGSTWPAALVAEYVIVTDLGVHEFASRTSDTIAVLNNTGADMDLAALSTYTLYRVKYPLPSYFGAFIDPITHENSPSQYLKEQVIFPEWTVRRIGNWESAKTGRPELFSVVNTVSETTGTPTWYLRVYPLPDAVYVLQSRIQVYPGDAVNVAGEIFPQEYSGLLIEATLAVAETLFNGERGVHSEEFDRMLPSYVLQDRRQRGVRRLLPQNSNKLPPHYEYLVAPVEYDGE